MLFGRKTPPAGAPKPQSAPHTAAKGAETAHAVLAEAGTAEPAAPSAAPSATTMSPLASLTNVPAASPAGHGPAPAGAIAGTSAQPSFPSAPSHRPAFPVSDKGLEMNTTTPKSPTGASLPGSSFKPTDIPRRTVDLPGVTPRRPDGFASPTAATPVATATPAANPAPIPPARASLAADQRRLIVGRDISLAGEIGSCDVLVVEGTVEAKLRDGRSIEIADTGLFKGSVEIDEADIGGRFEGDISVRGRLIVRSTGKITGSVKYGELTVESGGQLNGNISQYAAAAPAPVADAPTPANAG